MKLTQLDLVKFPETFRPVQRCTVMDKDGRPIATIDPRKRERVELRTGERTRLEIPEWEKEPTRSPFKMLPKRNTSPVADCNRHKITKGRDWYA